MFCHKCGRARDEGDRFCPFCGAETIHVSALTSDAPSAEEYFSLKKMPENTLNSAGAHLGDADGGESLGFARADNIEMPEDAASSFIPVGLNDVDIEDRGRCVAVISLVLSFAAFVMLFFGWLSWVAFVSVLPCSVAGLVLGIRAVGAFKRMENRRCSRSIGQLVVGVINTVVSAITLIIYAVYLALLIMAFLRVI